MNGCPEPHSRPTTRRLPDGLAPSAWPECEEDP